MSGKRQATKCYTIFEYIHPFFHQNVVGHTISLISLPKVIYGRPTPGDHQCAKTSNLNARFSREQFNGVYKNLTLAPCISMVFSFVCQKAYINHNFMLLHSSSFITIIQFNFVF